MGLLLELQTAVLQGSAEIAPVLLKLRLLAARLGSQPLADWVKYESEGYPSDVKVPDYRGIGVSYTATFFGPFGSSITNAPISPYLIEKYAGKSWTHYEMRESVAAIDELLANSEKGGSLHVEASNLILLLQGKIYKGYACNAVSGTIARSALAAIRHAVLSRVLELTLEIEKSVPEASSVSLDDSGQLSNSTAGKTTQITHQIIYGNYTSVSATGGSKITVQIGERDVKALASYLESVGISQQDAQEIANLAAREEPESVAEPMGPKVRGWLVRNIKKAATGTWKIGVAVATDVIKEALLKFYGLK